MEYEKLIEKHKIGYEITCLRYQKEMPYKEIARQLNLSSYNARDKQTKFLYDLLDFYICGLREYHIEIDIKELYDFYCSVFLSIAFLEKKYTAWLEILRHGKPPVIPNKYLEFPLYRKLTENNILEIEEYVREAREQQKKKFSEIGQELDLSKEKIKRIYEDYYHKKTRLALDRIKSIVGESVVVYDCKYPHNSYQRWKLIESEYLELVKDL